MLRNAVGLVPSRSPLVVVLLLKDLTAADFDVDIVIHDDTAVLVAAAFGTRLNDEVDDEAEAEAVVAASIFDDDDDDDVTIHRRTPATATATAMVIQVRY
jgi:hypothetical protein